MIEERPDGSVFEMEFDIDERLEAVREALIRLKNGETRKITIYRKGPIQES